jgi:REP element-mobilizing transposase RayT
MAEATATLDTPSRAVVDREIRSVVERRRWILLALNVRTNHVHAVVSAARRPELVLEAFKAFATRGLRDAGLTPAGGRVWTRHGSTRYLWSERDVEMAVTYTEDAQGPDLD